MDHACCTKGSAVDIDICLLLTRRSCELSSLGISASSSCDAPALHLRLLLKSS